MDSNVNSFRPALMAVIAGLLSAAGFYFGNSLYPVWGLMWLAPLPLLLVAPKTSWRMVFTAAFLARSLGGLSLWSYYRQLHVPIGVALAIVMVPALVLAMAVVCFRYFLRRGQPWWAVLSFPCLMVSFEYLLSLSSGTFGNIGYTQMNNLVALQVGSLTGLWGISFIVLLWSPMLVLLLLAPQGAARRLTAVVLVVIYGGVCAYGAWRLWTTPSAVNSVVVGMAASDLPRNIYLLDPGLEQQNMQLLRDYAGQVRILGGQGAKVVVLPEMIALVADPMSSEVDQLFEETARASNTQVVLGVLHKTSTGFFNEARLYSETGALVAVYRKQHLVPGLERRTTPGSEPAILYQPAGIIGLQICRDLDYPEPSSSYAHENVGLLLAPAWDFTVDRWWHGRMALMRGVEDGFSIVRSARQGLMTVSDDRGRVLAERSSAATMPFSTMLATVPVRHGATLYQRWGDWFAWLNLFGVAVLITLGCIRPRRYETPPRSITTGVLDPVMNFVPPQLVFLKQH